MPDTLPFTGVTLQAAGLSDYLTSLSRAESATINYERAVATLTTSINKSTLSDTEKQTRIASLTKGLIEVTDATQKYNLAVQSGNFQVMASQAEQLTAAIKDLNLQLALYGKNLTDGTTRQTSFMAQARGTRLAGLELVFALQLLSTSMGETLPQSAQEAQKGLQLVITGMLSGAYIGGTAGAVFGALAGAVLALGVASQTADADIAAFNKQIDQLAKHDDAAMGLAKLTGVSQSTAQAALDFAKKNQDAAASLQQMTEKVQDGIPVLQGIGDQFRNFGSLLSVVAGAVRSFTPGIGTLGDVLGGLPTVIKAAESGETAFYQTLQQGKSLVDAGRAALAEFTDTINNHKNALDAARKAIQEYANSVQTDAIMASRAHIQQLQNEFEQLRRSGAAVDDLRQKWLELQRAIEAAGASAGKVAGNLPPMPTFGGEGFVEAPARNDAEVAREAFAKFQSAVLDSESRLTEDEAAATEERNARLNEITTRGKADQARIIREYNQRIASIESQLAQDLQDAWTDYQSRLQDINDNAAQQNQQRDQQYADRREQILQQYADRREQIEQQYQDRVRQIQEQYALSFFEAESRRDAKAIIQARMARDKGLQDAAQTRDRENKSAADTRDRDLEAARKAQERAQKDQADALERQRKQAEQAYQKRLRDLQQAADKQRAQAAQNEKDQLSDLATNLAQQRAAENASYAAQIARARQANRDRIATLVQGLSQQKELTDEWGIKIIQSLSKILSPQQISDLIKQYKNALNIRFSVDISTINKGPTQTGTGPTKGPTAQTGNYVSATGPMFLHAGETVVNPDYPGRALDLLSRYVMPRMQLPLQGAGLMTGATRVQLSGDIKLNDPMLNGRILVIVDGHVAQVINSVAGSLSP